MQREERLATLTAEDLHLSLSVRKHIGAPTLVVDAPGLAGAYALEMTDVSSTTVSLFAVRAFVARAWLSRGSVKE